MEKKTGGIAIALLFAFALWTVLVRLVDVQAIGPESSSVGFATLNRFVHELTGVNWFLYTVTDWLGLVPIASAFGFAILGLVQLIRRKALWRVDRNLLLLGIFYAVVIGVYLLFERMAVNYRPTLIEGLLEASYPSSTTMLVTFVMPTAAIELNVRLGNTVLRRGAIVSITAFTAFMVIGRVLSGVHWITDIIGGALLGAGLVMTYVAFGNRRPKSR